MSCPCEKTVELLTKLGAKHAAKMHMADALDKEWSAADWRAHMEEEERLLFPMLARAMPERADLIKLLLLEHDVFKQELKILDKLSCAGLIERHSQLEDLLVGEYLNKGS